MVNYKRFDVKWSKDSSGCWLWQGAKIDGYGCMVNPNRPPAWLLAHRMAHERWVGPIPEGMYVCHHCDTRHCINPKHLFLGTHRDNIRDATDKGRMGKHPNSRNATKLLNVRKVKQIRKYAEARRRNSSDVSWKYERGVVQHLAETYDISIHTVYTVLSGRSWNV